MQHSKCIVLQEDVNDIGSDTLTSPTVAQTCRGHLCTATLGWMMRKEVTETGELVV